MYVSRAVGLRIKLRAGQIGHSDANGSLPQPHFFERSSFVRSRNNGIGSTNSLHTTACYSEYNESFDSSFLCVMVAESFN